MNSLAAKASVEYVLTILNGPEKGTAYKLVAGKITIGRSSDNNIAIKDDTKMSRNHAEIIIAARSVEIADISDRNKIVLNDEEVSRAELFDGSIILLGNTKLKFSVTEPGMHMTQVLDSANQSPLSSPRAKRRPNKGKLNFYLVVGVVVLILGWLLTSQTKKIPVNIRSADDIQGTIKSNTKVIEAIEGQNEKMGYNSRQYQEAQPNYIKGFRDYRKGQYERAVESFQACLSLFPQHIQCKTYLDRSQKKFSELVQYHMILANKYRSQNQYAACKSSYRNVMVMIKTTGNKTYEEAKSGYDACQALEGERY